MQIALSAACSAGSLTKLVMGRGAAVRRSSADTRRSGAEVTSIMHGPEDREDRPLAYREGWITGLDALHEGVPTWLWSSVDGFVDLLLESGDAHDRFAIIESLMRVERPLGERYVGDLFDARRDDLRDRMRSSGEFALGVIDHLLRLPLRKRHEESDYEYRLRRDRETGALAKLMRALGSSGSAFVVRPIEGGRFGLFRRTDPGFDQSIAGALESSGTASAHLRSAFEAAFGRDPRPPDACFAAVKAVEAAVKPIVSPNDSAATLGRMISDLEVNRDRYVARIETGAPSGRAPVDPVSTFRDLLRLIWQACGRHGSDDPSEQREVDAEAARDIVTLAASVVQLAMTGAVRRV